MWAPLHELLGTDSLADIRRDGVGEDIRGFVTGLSTDFVVVSVVGDECHFDGTSVLRTEDVSLVFWDDEVLRAWTGNLRESPSSPEPVNHIDLSSWESIIRSAAGDEPVLTFHREQLDARSCHIGTNIVLEGEGLSADKVSIEGTIDGKFALRLEDLTRVEFGGGYERALWRMIRAAE